MSRMRRVCGLAARAMLVFPASALAQVPVGADRLTIHYERNVAHAPAILDNIALKLDETPAGTYAVTIGILDHVTGRTTSRTINLTVLERKQ